MASTAGDLSTARGSAICLSADFDPQPEPIAAEESSPAVASDLRAAFADCATALYRFILVRVGNDRHAADDLLQDCCHQAARHSHPPTDASTYPAWFMGIAKNLIRKHWRTRRAAQTRMHSHDPELCRQLADRLDTPVEIIVNEESVAQLMLAITSLPPADQQLLFSFYFDGRPSVQIAADLGATAKGIEARLYRARARLRDALRRTDMEGVV